MMNVLSLRAICVAALCCISAEAFSQETLPSENVNPSTVNETVRVVYRAFPDPNEANPGALVTDVFWCSGDDKAAGRALAASELAATISTLVQLDPKMLKLVREIRTRPIAKDLFLETVGNAASAETLSRPLVSYDVKDPDLSAFAINILSNPLLKTTPLQTDAGEYVPNYASVYVCANVDSGDLSGRVFFQVKQGNQKDKVADWASGLQNEYPSLSVIPDIEVVGSKSPKNSEIRYFFSKDKDLAAKVAEQLSGSGSGDLILKQVHGFEAKVRPGTLEAWIAN